MQLYNYQRHRAVTVLLFFSLHFFHRLLPTVNLLLSYNEHVYTCVCMSVSISAEVRESSPIHCNTNCTVHNQLQLSRLFEVVVIVVVVLLLLHLILFSSSFFFFFFFSSSSSLFFFVFLFFVLLILHGKSAVRFVTQEIFLADCSPVPNS